MKDSLSQNTWFWIGLLGQAIFGARFVVQWLYSEYKKKSVIPVMFWYLSLVGSIVLLMYAIHIDDLVFTLGYSLNLIIYIRNLVMVKREKQKEQLS